MADHVRRRTVRAPGIEEFEEIELPAAAEELVSRTEQNGGFGGEYVLGAGRVFYRSQVLPVANEIQYCKTRVPAGSYSKIRLFLISGGASGATIRVGVFSDVNDDPASLQRSGSQVLVLGDNLNLLELSLGSLLVLSVPTLIWIAASSTSALPKFIGTNGGLHGRFHPIRFQTTSDGVLPATATPTKTGGAILYAALIP